MAVQIPASQNLVYEIFDKTDFLAPAKKFLPSPMIYYTCLQNEALAEKQRWNCLRGTLDSILPQVPLGVKSKEESVCFFSVSVGRNDVATIQKDLDRRFEAKYPNHTVISSVSEFPK